MNIHNCHESYFLFAVMINVHPPPNHRLTLLLFISFNKLNKDKKNPYSLISQQVFLPVCLITIVHLSFALT